MKWFIFLCVVAAAVACMVRAQPLANDTLEEFPGVDVGRLTDRLGQILRRVYERSDRYDLASYLLRAVFEHLFVLFYRGF